jgi:hypothetical protein
MAAGSISPANRRNYFFSFFLVPQGNRRKLNIFIVKRPVKPLLPQRPG